MALPIPIINSDFADFTDLPGSIDFTARMEPYILQAQRIDLKRTLGIRFYNQVIKGIADATLIFQTLRDGEEYDDDGIVIKYEGLKPIIVNYALARFYTNQDVNITRRGIVRKTNDLSEPLSGAEKQGLIIMAKSTAKSYEEELRAYLKFNRTIYPAFFDCDPDQQPQLKTAIRISAGRGQARTIIDPDQSKNHNDNCCDEI